MEPGELTGLLIIDKPPGPTSHDVVDQVRRVIHDRRVGHTGTLDPMATGVLVLCVGKATRIAEYLTGHDKRYLAHVRFGSTTATYDADGEVLSSSSRRPDRQALDAALEHFRGAIEQRPPAYSAVRLNGQRAHLRARRGQAIDLPPRRVQVRELQLLDYDGDAAIVDVRCSAGTYIRSLAHDLGQLLGCGAHLAALRRTACGTFQIDDAVALSVLLDASHAPADAGAYLHPAGEGLMHLPLVLLDAEQEQRIVHGQFLTPPVGIDNAPLWRACRADGTLIAVLRRDEATGQLRPRKVLAGG